MAFRRHPVLQASMRQVSRQPRCLRRPAGVSGHGVVIPSEILAGASDFGAISSPNPHRGDLAREIRTGRSQVFQYIASVTLSGHVTEYRRPRAALEDDQEEAGLVALTKALAIRMPRDSAGVRALPLTMEDPRNPPLESSPFKLAT